AISARRRDERVHGRADPGRTEGRGQNGRRDLTQDRERIGRQLARLREQADSLVRQHRGGRDHPLQQRASFHATSPGPGIVADAALISLQLTEAIMAAWGRILTGHMPALSVESTRKCPPRCAGGYGYG